MKSEEGMDLAKMAVTVLLVVLLIGAVVALVYAAYSWFNSGTDKLADQVNSIGSSAYSRFDDAQVSGTDVLTALKEYRDSNIAIVICTGKGNTKHYGDYATVNATTGEITNTSTDIKGYNYCGLFRGVDASGLITLSNDKGELSFEGMKWDNSAGIVERNTNFSPTTKKGDGSYVKQGAQFYAKLIIDTETQEVGGICFMQMGVKGTTP